MERDDKRILIDGGLCDFNSHAHVERDRVIDELAAIKNHFNSHAHVERDFPDDIDNAGKAISTHTLTWSVTLIERQS